MTICFYLKVKIGKLFANLVSAFIRDKEKRHKLRERLDPLSPARCVDYLKRYTHCSPQTFSSDDKIADDTIWTCWLQGRNQAPPLVANCLNSIEHYKRQNQKMVLITADNYSNYVDLPSIIIEKWHKGIISNTHFSDILRVHLLARHGGYWIDATCLQVAPMPLYIEQLPLFLFRSHGEFSFTLIQSCFIYCRKNSYVLQKWSAVIDQYWKQENSLIHYFTLHLMFIALVEEDSTFRKEFESIPQKDDEAMHYLLKKMMAGHHFTDTLLDEACQQLFVQKLTYKFSPDLLSDKQSIANALSVPIRYQ